MRVLIVGCGYIGLPLGAELLKQGHSVSGLRRTGWPEGEQQFTGISRVVADVTKPETLACVPAVFDWVAFCVSASGGGVEEYRQVYLEGLRNVVAWLAAAPPQRFVYTSSTSVYGQTDGLLVDEKSPTEPAMDTARVLVDAEKAFLKEARLKGIPAIILRLAGIYGPGRGYWLKQFLEGKAIIEGDGQRILNMIHRDDVVRAVTAALHRGQAGEIYNVVDDEPVSQLVCFNWLSQRLGREFPAVPANPAVARKRGMTNKRVSNYRLRAELECVLKYPTFRQGFEEEIRRLRGKTQNQCSHTTSR
jgi:nucleoside-diphosphate-sugar epimerase